MRPQPSTCAIEDDGSLRCWGDDEHGQVGNGGPFDQSEFPPGVEFEFPPASARTEITRAHDWTSVDGGATHTCAIRSTGKLYCWGADDSGQLGDGGANTDVSSPVRITTVDGWRSVSAGGSHTCAIRYSGKLYCWGSDTSGQVGDGSQIGADRPRQITNATDWRSVSAGGNHTCAVRSTGKLYCWGADESGQVGDGSLTGATSPRQIATATDWKMVAAGGQHSCAIRSVGKLHCWGSDQDGQLGDGGTNSNSSWPKQVGTWTGWTSVSAGEAHTEATYRPDELYAWGSDDHYQLGTRDAGNQPGMVGYEIAPGDGND